MPNKFRITFVINPCKEKAAQDAIVDLSKDFGIDYQPVRSIADMYSLLSNPQFSTDAFLIDIEHLYSDQKITAYDLLNTLSTLIESTVMRAAIGVRPERRKTKIYVLASVLYDPCRIKEVSKLPFVYGVVPRIGDGVSTDAIRSATKMVVDLVPGIHSSLREAMKAAKKKHVPQTASLEPQLTDRQAQILRMINERGSSNKVIAKTLNITESTVKLHMTGLLKKFGCKNRTQLAVFSKTSSTKTQVHDRTLSDIYTI